MQVKFHHSKEEAPGIVSLFFERIDHCPQIAGQFIEINLQHNSPDARGIRRWFTLSSAPEDEFLSITTRFLGKNSSSFKRAFTSLEPGTILSFSPPEGDFVLPDDKEQPLIFIAGGIGITPFHSMASHLLQTHEKRHITLIHGINTLPDAIFADIFEAYGADLTHVVTNPPGNWQGETGFITPDRVMKAVSEQSDPLIYLSGPEPMVEKLDKELKAQGLAGRQIKTDFFPGYNNI